MKKKLWVFLGAILFLGILGALTVFSGDPGQIAFFGDDDDLLGELNLTWNETTDIMTLRGKELTHACSHVTEIHGFSGQELLINISDYPGEVYNVSLC